MSEMRAVEAVELSIGVPVLTRGWRMRMSMERAGLSREYMAMKLGVSPSTVSRWLHDQGKRQPREPDMRTWAEECRVVPAWLAPSTDDEPVPTVTLPKVTTKLATSTPQPDISTPRRGHLRVIG